ncbi:hypothetical protein G9A89_000184 [Geosiphon pyriformis]|nr:hypothetical protein G9A89_000184 [Geosiphon pyriformis]
MVYFAIKSTLSSCPPRSFYTYFTPPFFVSSVRGFGYQAPYQPLESNAWAFLVALLLFVELGLGYGVMYTGLYLTGGIEQPSCAYTGLSIIGHA